MKKLCFIAALIMALGIQSCGSDDDLPGGGTDLPTISENKILEGTKWTNRTFDFEVADDVSWAYWFTEITNIYFYSNREGAFYYSRKSDYSDTGAHSERQVCFFTYKVDNSNSVVELNPLNYECDGFSRYLKLRGGNIVLDDQAMTKGDISSSDMAWINSITGVTGDCKWYYDMKKVLSIVGNGVDALANVGDRGVGFYVGEHFVSNAGAVENVGHEFGDAEFYESGIGDYEGFAGAQTAYDFRQILARTGSEV